MIKKIFKKLISLLVKSKPIEKILAYSIKSRNGAVLYYNDQHGLKVMNLVNKIRKETDILMHNNEAYQIYSAVEKTAKIEGFEVAAPEVLLILKQGAELDRGESVKGLKDRIDIMTLLCFTGIDFAYYRELLARHKLENYRQRLKMIISAFKDVKYLNLNVQEYARKKKELLKRV